MPDLSRYSGDLGGPPERLGPQPEPRGLVNTRSNANRWIGAFVVDGPAKPRARVCDLVVHETVSEGLLWTPKQLERSFSLIREEQCVPIAHGLAFAAFGQALLRELPDRLQHAVAELSRGAVNGDKGFADQRVEHIEHLDLIEFAVHVVPAHGRGGPHRQATRAHRTPPEGAAPHPRPE